MVPGRICVYYCKLSAVTKKDTYPIPWIKNTLDTLNRMKIISKLS